jgi:hypothetical protein
LLLIIGRSWLVGLSGPFIVFARIEISNIPSRNVVLSKCAVFDVSPLRSFSTQLLQKPRDMKLLDKKLLTPWDMWCGSVASYASRTFWKFASALDAWTNKHVHVRKSWFRSIKDFEIRL